MIYLGGHTILCTKLYRHYMGPVCVDYFPSSDSGQIAKQELLLNGNIHNLLYMS